MEASIFNASAPGAAAYARRIDDEFVKMGLRGLTVVVASGDDGVGSFWARPERDGAPRRCAERAWAEWPASSPYVLTVGATQLTDRHLAACDGAGALGGARRAPAGLRSRLPSRSDGPKQPARRPPSSRSGGDSSPQRRAAPQPVRWSAAKRPPPPAAAPLA